ncbi:hypothetical protein [Bacillus mycoides]|uniref:hypothetical protein n=1 Tax=Bacillus mycoides TaxID=1405 RepID=UPI000BF88D93|nr:hypothetical protein [Bacillus mycoides]PGA03597.1 hypothetical protein COL71_28950 [Bacillus mycoides]
MKNGKQEVLTDWKENKEFYQKQYEERVSRKMKISPSKAEQIFQVLLDGGEEDEELQKMYALFKKHNWTEEQLQEMFSPFFDFDFWEKQRKDALESAEIVSKKGWTFPQMMSHSMIAYLANIESHKELEREFEEFYSTNGNYAKMKQDILTHEFILGWKELLEQCFENYEKEQYYIAIPSLFIIIEGLAHMLVSPKFQKYRKFSNRTNLRNQYEKVKQDVAHDDIYIIIYVSVLELFNEVFKSGNFDKNPERYPIINRDWVLHGRDIPSNWKRVDALRLFNVIYSITSLDVLLEESEEN